jgi:long-chain acyl-CoA synthetase
MISHKNLVSLIAVSTLNGRLWNQKDVYFSYLPLPHIMERAPVNILLYHGGSIGFYSG